MKLIAALVMLSLPAAAATSGRFSVGVTVVRSATVSTGASAGGVRFQSRGEQPGQVKISPPDAAGEVVVTLLY